MDIGYVLMMNVELADFLQDNNSMKQKTITLQESQIYIIQKLANKDQEGDFSRMIRKIIEEWIKD